MTREPTVPGSADERSTESGSVGPLMLAWTILRLNFLLLARYRLNFLASVVGMYLFFVFLFFGSRTIASIFAGGAGAFGQTLDAIIVGWFLWTMAVNAYSSLSVEVTRESRWGTLEQLYMSPHGFGTIMTVKVAVNVFISLMLGGLMLVLMLLTTGRTLALDPFSIVPIAILSLMSVVGVGYAFAGLALVYKKISRLSQLMQFVLIGLITVPVTDASSTAVLPLVQGSALLQENMRSGTHLWEFAPLDVGILVATAVGYWALGYAVFAFCSRVARNRGVMGHY